MNLVPSYGTISFDFTTAARSATIMVRARFLHVILSQSFGGLGVIMSKSHNRLRALRVSVEALTQQFEELQQLRHRLRRVEAKAICTSRYQRSCWRGKRARCGSPRRHGPRLRYTLLHCIS